MKENKAEEDSIPVLFSKFRNKSIISLTDNSMHTKKNHHTSDLKILMKLRQKIIMEIDKGKGITDTCKHFNQSK